MSVKDRARAALATATEIQILVSEVHPYPGQPRDRFNIEAIRRLSDSIRAGGQTTPGLVRRNPNGPGYQLIDGERRWRAVHLIPAAERPLYRASLVDVDDEGAQFLLSGIANLNREGHTAVEAMRAIDRLRGLDLSMEEVAELFGKSPHWCYQMHSLRNLVPEVLKMVDPDLPREQQLPATVAVQIAKAPKDLQLGLARRFLRGEVSTATVRGEVVKTAEQAGKAIRVREQPPLKRWESFCARIGVGSGALVGAAGLVEGTDLDRIIKAHPDERARSLAQLRRAGDAIRKIEDTLRRAVG